MAESKRTRELCKRFELLGAMTYPLIAGMKSPSGWPDRLTAYKGVMFLVEWKEGNNWLEPAQRRTIGRIDAPVLIASIQKAGEKPFVWDNAEKKMKRLLVKAGREQVFLYDKEEVWKESVEANQIQLLLQAMRRVATGL